MHLVKARATFSAAKNRPSRRQKHDMGHLISSRGTNDTSSTDPGIQ